MTVAARCRHRRRRYRPFDRANLGRERRRRRIAKLENEQRKLHQEQPRVLLLIPIFSLSKDSFQMGRDKDRSSAQISFF